MATILDVSFPVIEGGEDLEAKLEDYVGDRGECVSAGTWLGSTPRVRDMQFELLSFPDDEDVEENVKALLGEGATVTIYDEEDDDET